MQEKITVEALAKKEDSLKLRKEKLARMEAEIRAQEAALKQKEKQKKQVLLRLSPSLWEQISAWAEDDFRSINGQIEFLLSEAIRMRRKNKQDSTHK